MINKFRARFKAISTGLGCWQMFSLTKPLVLSQINSHGLLQTSEWEQYTGITDENGVGSCIGDIVKAELQDLKTGKSQCEYIGVISFGETEIELDTTDHVWPCASWLCVKSFEVIGNIHENPELLNEK